MMVRAWCGPGGANPDSPRSNLGSKANGEDQAAPTTEYTSKQPSDRVVPLVPRTGIFLGPSKSGKTVALISVIPVKKYIEEDLGVNTERAPGPRQGFFWQNRKFGAKLEFRA